MLERASLFFCHIDNANLGDPLVDMVGDLLDRTLMVLNMDGGSPCLIEIHQQAGRHIAGIRGQTQIVMLVRDSQRGDCGGRLQDHLCVLQHSLPVGGGLYSFCVSNQKGPP